LKFASVAFKGEAIQRSRHNELKRTFMFTKVTYTFHETGNSGQIKTILTIKLSHV